MPEEIEALKALGHTTRCIGSRWTTNLNILGYYHTKNGAWAALKEQVAALKRNKELQENIEKKRNDRRRIQA